MNECLFCDGYNYQCEKYAPNETELCQWYKVVDNDLLKLICGVRPLTFDKLEGLVNG